MRKNKYHMNLKVNSLGSRIIKVNAHDAFESLAVHVILFIIIGFLTFTAYKLGEVVLMYFGLAVTSIFLLIVLADIYFMISNHLTKSEEAVSDEE